MVFFDQIKGLWRLERVIDDRRAGQIMNFEGQLEAKLHAQGLELAEHGSWRDAPWGALTAQRVDFWRATEDGVHVFYEDGRFFHSFDPARGICTHLCGADTYQGRYDFDFPNGWQLEWRVAGPRKDYLMRSRYIRPA